MEEGAAEYEDRTPVESESPRLDLPQVGNKERDRELQEYMKDWTHTRWPEHGEIPPSTSTPRPGSLPRVHKQKDKRLGEIQEQEGHGTRGNQEGRRSERGHEGGNRARGAPHTTGGGKSEPRDNVGRVVRIEGDVVLSPYAIEEDKELEGRIRRLEDGISYGVGKMDELKNLAGQAFQMATAVKNKYAHKPRLGESKSQRSRRALNQSAGKHVKSLSKASKVLIYHKQKKKQVSSDMDLDEQVGTESEGTDTDNEGKVEQDVSEEEDLEPRGARSLWSRASLKPPVRFEPGITAYLAHARSQSEPSLTQVGGSPPGQMMPLMVKGKALHYAPWNFMDLTGLIQRLPNLCEGGQKWITQFEEKTSGQHLAIGDIKAILCQTVGKGRAEEIFDGAEHRDLIDDPKADAIPFGLYRQEIWDAVRSMFPAKMDPGKLENIKLKDEENVITFIQKFQDKWRDETGAKWDDSVASVGLFKLLLKKALPGEVQKKLEEVVGLNAMEWASFLAHVTHHVEQHRKLKKEAKDATETLMSQLCKAQLGELTRTKQEEKERRREHIKQAAVMVPHPQASAPAQVDPMLLASGYQAHPQQQVPHITTMLHPAQMDYIYHMRAPMHLGMTPAWGRGFGKPGDV
ncbi:uncharacterized protein LOC128609515 [Ictalurus furcatus]|uniref:uncharacterized protein LOC128609515 n=1 Tax=Ictalurus furcatus TaxID=66913 RepID=UPI002350F9EB|nr:uncharacterized protein LOC128609515 [Ictalurus furcatus]